LRERESEHVQAGAEAEGERESPADSPLSAETKAGLDARVHLPTLRSGPEQKARVRKRLHRPHHPGAPTLS